jgi:hypothetical protein
VTHARHLPLDECLPAGRRPDGDRERRREIGKEERVTRSTATEYGVNMAALKITRQMQQMDQIERQEIFDAVVGYTKVFRFW